MKAWSLRRYFLPTESSSLCGIQIPGPAGCDSASVSPKDRSCSQFLGSSVKNVVNLLGTLGKPDRSNSSRRRAHSESDEAWSDRTKKVGGIGYEVMPHIPEIPYGLKNRLIVKIASKLCDCRPDTDATGPGLGHVARRSRRALWLGLRRL